MTNASGTSEAALRPSRHQTPSLSWQAISFAAVGASGTALTFVLLTVLHKGLGWRLELANVLAYAAGIANNYVWNRLWTFRHVARRSMLHQGGQFAAVSLAGLALNTLVLSLLLHHGVNYLLGFGIAAVVTYGWNFAMNHRVTFRHHRPAMSRHAVPGDGD